MPSQKLPTLVLKAKKEKAIRNFHHWIFDGAVKELSDEVPDGGLAQVLAENGEVLGIAYVNRKSRIIGRMIAFGGSEKPVENDAALQEAAILALSVNLDRAIHLRRQFFDPAITNAYRLVNSEGDGIPGLIVDWYADGVVLQITTLGMERLKSKIVEMLRQKLQPKWIYEKSTSPSRKEEGLSDQEGWVWRHGEALKNIFSREIGDKLAQPPRRTTQRIAKTGDAQLHKNLTQIFISLPCATPPAAGSLRYASLASKKNSRKDVFQNLPHDIVILENGVKFFVDIVGGQKTGFYLDQREMRKMVGELARGRKVLNCFSYTGGFSVFAVLGGVARSAVRNGARVSSANPSGMKDSAPEISQEISGRESASPLRGAASVMSVDDSKEAIEMGRRNFEINCDANIRIHANNANEEGRFRFQVADVFDYLRQTPIDADFIILDPPAFAKKKADLKKACRAYQNLNRLAMQKITTPGLLLTCSCSYAVDERLFQQIIFEAALQAKRRVRILSRHREAFDHPVNIYHPEGRYLKGFLLQVD